MRGFPVASLMVCMVACAGSGAAQEWESGVIQGRVVDAVTGQPVAGINIGLARANDQPPPQRTDPKGEFRFTGLIHTQYTPVIFPGAGYFNQRLMYTLPAGGGLTGLEIKAYKEGVIAGRVMDRDHRPQPGVEVSALIAGSAGDRMAPGRGSVTRTNDLGEFRLQGLRPGQYQLFALPPASARLTPAPSVPPKEEPAADTRDVPTYYPNADVLAGAAVLSVAAGQAVEDIEIILAKGRTSCLTSQVTGGGEAKVRLQLVGDWYSGAGALAQGEMPAHTPFEICGVPPGDYRLLASVLDGQPGALYGALTLSTGSKRLRAPDIALHATQPFLARAVIEGDNPPASFEGPLTLLLQPTGRSPFMGERLFARATAPGGFQAPAVVADEYLVRVTAPPGLYVSSARVGPLDALRSPVRPGGEPLEVRLSPGGASLVVAVAGEDGKPVAAYVILGLDKSAADFRRADLFVTVSNQDGVARFEGLPPGDYRLLAIEGILDDAKASRPSYFFSRRDEGEKVTLRERDKRQVQVKPLPDKP